MSLFRPASDRELDIGLGIMRTIVGAIFIAHGAQKLFTFGLAGVTAGFAEMGIPLAGVLAPFVALLEFAGGIALVAGVLTRVFSLALVFDMLGAILFVHLSAGFFLPNGYEFALALAGASALLTLAGAGAYSIDALIARRTAAGARSDVAAIRRRRAA
jgi:putative oxidoreductase